MASRGLFCFVVVLLFIPLHLVMLSANSSIEAGMQDAGNALLEMERLNYIRTEIEENTDLLILQTLEAQVMAGKSKPDAVKEAVDEKLLWFFNEAEKNYSRENVKFLVSGREIGIEGLGENTKVLVIKEGNLVYAEFSYTGGMLKDNKLYAVIKGKRSRQVFEIPIGYTIMTGGIAGE